MYVIILWPSAEYYSHPVRIWLCGYVSGAKVKTKQLGPHPHNLCQVEKQSSKNAYRSYPIGPLAA